MTRPSLMERLERLLQADGVEEHPVALAVIAESTSVEQALTRYSEYLRTYHPSPDPTLGVSSGTVKEAQALLDELRIPRREGFGQLLGFHELAPALVTYYGGAGGRSPTTYWEDENGLTMHMHSRSIQAAWEQISGGDAAQLADALREQREVFDTARPSLAPVSTVLMNLAAHLGCAGALREKLAELVDQALDHGMTVEPGSCNLEPYEQLLETLKSDAKVIVRDSGSPAASFHRVVQFAVGLPIWVEQQGLPSNLHELALEARDDLVTANGTPPLDEEHRRRLHGLVLKATRALMRVTWMIGLVRLAEVARPAGEAATKPDRKPAADGEFAAAHSRLLAAWVKTAAQANRVKRYPFYQAFRELSWLRGDGSHLYISIPWYPWEKKRGPNGPPGPDGRAWLRWLLPFVIQEREKPMSDRIYTMDLLLTWVDRNHGLRDLLGPSMRRLGRADLADLTGKVKKNDLVRARRLLWNFIAVPGRLQVRDDLEARRRTESPEEAIRRHAAEVLERLPPVDLAQKTEFLAYWDTFLLSAELIAFLDHT